MTPAIALHGDRGPRVLLVMGFGMTGAMWQPISERLRIHCRVATYDHPGTGASPGPSPRSMRGLSLAAAGVLDALSWDRAHIIGVSMGGMVAQELAIGFPERIASLSLLATHAGGPGAQVPTWQGLLVLAAPFGKRWKMQHMLYPNDYRAKQPERLERRVSAQLAQHVPKEAIAAQFRAVASHDTRARLDRIDAPTLVIEAARDRLVRPSQTRALAAAIPGARFVKLPDAGHGLVVQEAERLEQLLLDHVSRAEATTSHTRL